MDCSNVKVGIVGCGKMGGALVNAIAKVVSPERIFVCDHNADKCTALAEALHIRVCGDAVSVAEESDLLFVCVKPHAVAALLGDITSLVGGDKIPLFVSIAAGLKIARLKKAALTEVRFVRLMPNLPVQVGEGMIALCAEDDISTEEIALVKAVLAAAGVVEQVPESLMDCVTGVSGSAPAFGFMFVEALADAAVKLGMPRKQAYVYAAQTLKGAAAMVLETGEHPAVLKDGVCSPGGTTIAGVASLEENGFRSAVIKATVAAAEKSASLAAK